MTVVDRSEDVSGEKPAWYWIHGDIPEHIVKAIDDLPQDESAVLKQRLGIGEKRRFLPKEIADAANLSVSDVSQAQVRGLQRLMERLTEPEFRMLRASMPRAKLGAAFMGRARQDGVSTLVQPEQKSEPEPEQKEEMPATVQETPVAPIATSSSESFVTQVMERIPPHTRAVMRRRLGADIPALTEEETAEALCIDVRTVRTYQSNAISHLKKSFAPEEIDKLRARLSMRAAIIPSGKAISPAQQSACTIEALDARLKNMETLLYQIVGSIRVLIHNQPTEPTVEKPPASNKRKRASQ